MIANWINEAFFGFDYAILQFCHTLAETAGGIFGPIMELLAFIGDNGYFSFALALILLLFPKTRKCGVCMILAVGVGALFTNVAIKNIVARPRPYASGVEAFNEWWQFAGAHLESEFSFPSGHTASSFAAAIGLFIYHKKLGIAALIWATLVAFSRLYMYVHYPTDILAGIVMGIICAAIGMVLVNKFYQPISDKITEKFKKKRENN